MEIQRIIGKKSLTIVITGEKELAAQIFSYEKVKEVRLDLENLEVKLLMDYDEAYYKVFKIEPNKELPEEKCKEIIIQFYNNLLNSSMRLSEEEMKNLQKQQKENIEKMQREKK